MGTLCQLRNLINRRNVTKKPKENVNASEDFLEIVTIGHILTAVMSYLKMSSLDDMPSSDIVPHDIWMEDDNVRRQVLEEISQHIVNTHIDLALTFKQPSSIQGTVYDYACEALSLGLLAMDYKDAVREGDGEHITDLLWKYLMLLFKASGRKNYAIEGLTLLSQCKLILPPNLAEQVKWSRFVNTHGLPGHNVSCDLHMEHMNKLVKVAIEGLGANKTKKAIERVAKAIGVLSDTTESYSSEVGLEPPSGKHSDTQMTADLSRIIMQLLECDVFNPKTKAVHNSFTNLKTNLIKTLEEDKLKDWMVKQFSMLLQPDFTPLNIDSDNEM